VADEVGPFDRRTLAWLAGIGGGSLLLCLYLLLALPAAPDVASAQADAYSRSAVGHRAFLELLRMERMPAVVSRYASAARAAGSAVLVLLEPGDRRYRLKEMLETAEEVVIVLPKWRGREDPDHRGWLKGVTLRPTNEIADLLSAADVSATVRRFDRRGPLACGAWTADILAPQLLESTSLEAVVQCDGGILVGQLETDDGRITVVADPDVFANHGIGRGQNAAIALAAVREAGAPGKTLIVDETLHGYEAPPSLWHSLFRFPLSPAVAQAGLIVLALVWAGLPRFGAPLPLARPLDSGKRTLIENTASLLRLGGHGPHVLERYLDAAVEAVRATLHVPTREPRAQMLARLAARSSAGGVDLRRIEPLVRRIQAGAAAGDAVLLSLAQKIHQWKEEIIRGPRISQGR